LGVSGITVQVYSYTTQSILPSVTTNSAGQYTVSNTPTGGVAVFETIPSGTINTQPGTIPSTTISGAYYSSVTTGNTSTFNFGNAPASAVVLPTGTITGTIYNDANGNGIQNVGELGVSGITVQVYSYATHSALTSVTTNSAGQYTVSNTPTGGVAVFETIPSGTINTQPGTIPSTTISGAYYSSVTTGNTSTFNFGNAPASAVVLPTGTITGTIYNDANGNGIQNVGELGVSGITVQVYSYATHSALTPVTTNSAGQYTVSNTPTGGVAVFETIPSGTINTQPGTIPSTTISGAYYSSVTTGNTSTFNFGNAPASAVVLPTGTITGTIYNDANGNGIQNVGELGVSGITV